MKTFKKVLTTFVAASLIVSSVSFTSLAATTDDYNENGDFAANGEFPETGTILDWHFYARPKGMQNAWANLKALGISFDDYEYADDTSVNNGYFRFETNGTTADGKDIWSGASTIKNGVLQIDANIYVPELKNPNKEKYAQYFSIWGKNTDDSYYNEQGSLYSVIMNDDQDLYVGFNTRDHHEAAKSIDAENVSSVKIDTQKWYKLSAIINYDAKTLDYFLNDEYVCSHKSFANDGYYYEMGSLYYSLYNEAIKNETTPTNETHVYVTGVKITRKPTILSAKSEITANNKVKVNFDEAVKTDTITNDTFEVKDALGKNYTVLSVETPDAKNAVITVNGSFTPSETVTVVAKNDITAITSVKMETGSSSVALPMYDDGSFVNMDFENTAFPSSWLESKAFTDFYLEYPSYSTYQLHDSDFVNSKEYFDATGDNYYMNYNWRYYEQIADVNSSGKALNFHRNIDGKIATYWSNTVKTIGLVIPFKNGKSVNSGKITIEFDGGKVGTKNTDVYTIGLHDKNNEIRKYDINNAFSNSTALFTFGDYFETATLLYAPRGRSAGYSWYVGEHSNPTDKLLWPSNWDTVQNNNMVRKYKVELNLDTKTYNVYQNGELIGDTLSLPETENDPCYDAFVLGTGLDSRDAMSNIDHSFYLDNLTIVNPDSNVFKAVSVQNADGSDYTGKIKDNTVVFNFNRDIKSANVTVGETAVTPTIEAGKITVSLENIKMTGNTTIKLSNITSQSGEVIDELKTLTLGEKVKMSGYFTETPAGITLILDDGGSTDKYDVIVAGYAADGKLAAIEFMKEKAEDGIYPLTEVFSAASEIKGFVFGEKLIPLSDCITEFKE